MNPKNFKFHKSRFYPALVLDSIFSHRNRHKLLSLLRIILVILFIILALGIGASRLGFLDQYEKIAPSIFNKIAGLFFIFLAITIYAFLWESFFRNYYLKKKGFLSGKKIDNIADFFDFEASHLIYKAWQKGRANFKGFDLVKSFLNSEMGRMTLARSGIAERSSIGFQKNLREEISSKGTDILQETLLVAETNKRKIASAEDLITSLFRKEKQFADWLFDFEIKERELGGALNWVLRSIEKKKMKEAWWRKERLERIPGLAKDWAYGETYILDRYAHDVSYTTSPADSLKLVGKEEQIKQIEMVLARRNEANILIVGEPGVGRKTLIVNLARMIGQGKIVPALENKRMVQLDTDSIIAATKHKGEFEELLIKIFNQTVSAGNIILMIDDFPSFVQSASTLGSDITSLLSPYFISPSLQIIAIVDTDDFYRTVEPNSGLMKFFEKITIEEPDKQNSISILEEAAEETERRSNIFFTYPVIREIVRAADRYLTEGVMPEKAIDLLAELIPFVLQKKRNIAQREDVMELINIKTKIPVGKIKPEEKEKLMNLEKVLHKRVIGQEEAISAISDAVRRARSEIRDIKKPIGSFLFLGPTGVGKTETAKALTEVFFGDEKNILRFDMSEYQTADAIERLIGSFSKNKPGTLANSLRENPYGLLLMDEFEKTSPTVLNLFLQILDEGFFTDAFGKRVNARNIIFIATSNAGANLIWDFVKKGINPVTMREEIIDKIRGIGIFKPELLNRFGRIVIFHPLNNEHLKKIAAIMLNKLNSRLKEKDIELVINDALLEKLTKWGYNPVFGARPMQRTIQRKIEQYIARGLISGKIQRGSKVEFSTEELDKMD